MYNVPLKARQWSADLTGNTTYKKDRKTGEYINEPVDAYNHCIDSLRYGSSEYNGMASPKATVMKNIYI